MDVLARFVSGEEAAKLKRNGYYGKTQDGLEVLLPQRGVVPGEKVYLGISKFFWAKHIIVRGIKTA